MKFDEHLKDCLGRYSTPTQQFAEMYHAVVDRSESAKESLIPVLGMQGMGKSTLINGLLKANILPNDADETTCVPVEISYGDKEYGEVLFTNHKNSVIVHTREELNAYVDNNENTANKKGVECIKLYRKAEILKSGLTLVDLPGVGSITLENERTTHRYIKNVATAIFVIPTVPTIRRMEEIFIQGAWSQFSNAMFVQNEWNDTQEEIRDSVDHNTKILNQLAAKIGSKFEGPIEVVNAFDAVKGAIEGNDKLIEKSNIKSLEKRIVDISTNWSENLQKNLETRIRGIVAMVLSIAKGKLKDAQKSEEQQKEEKKNLYEKFKREAESIIKKAQDTESWLSSQEPVLKKEMRDLINKTVGDIRADIFQKIDAGIYDGERLEKAFNDIQTLHVQSSFDDAVERMRVFAIDFQSKMQELENMLADQFDLKFDPEQHKTDNAFKWEKGLEVAGGLGGGLLAVALLSNPVGWLGLAITGVVTLIANLFKRGVKAQRAKKAKEDIGEPIEKVHDKLSKEIFSNINEMVKQCRELLSKIVNDQEEETRNMRREARKLDKSVDLEKIEQDVKYLESYLKSL